MSNYQHFELFSINPSWRNWLARSTVNRKVGGSSPPEGDYLFLFCCHLTKNIKLRFLLNSKLKSGMNILGGYLGRYKNEMFYENPYLIFLVFIGATK